MYRNVLEKPNELFFTFVWPCIVTNFFVIKPTTCTNFTNLFCHEILHVSDSSSVHHQEFIHCTLSNGICHTGLKTRVSNGKGHTGLWRSWLALELSASEERFCSTELVYIYGQPAYLGWHCDSDERKREDRLVERKIVSSLRRLDRPCSAHSQLSNLNRDRN